MRDRSAQLALADTSEWTEGVPYREAEPPVSRVRMRIIERRQLAFVYPAPAELTRRQVIAVLEKLATFTKREQARMERRAKKARCKT